MKITRWLLPAIAGLSLCLSLPAQAEPPSPAKDPAAARSLELINKSGRQRMLSQRVAKAYFQLALRLDFEKSRDALAKGLADLRAAQADIKKQVAGNELASLATRQGALIEQLADATGGVPVAAKVPAVDKAADALLDNAEQLTEGIRKSSGTTTASLLNLAARQRMLSQRIAKEFFLYQLVRSPETKAALVQAAQDFSAVLAAFDSHRAEYPGVASQINSAKIQMFFLEDGIKNYESPNRQQMEAVATASEYIHDEMNALVVSVQKALENR